MKIMLIQKLQRAKLYTVFLAIQCLCLVSACGGGGGGSAQAAPTTPSAPNAPATPQTIAAPTITATAAQNGAVIISMSSTTSGAAIYYSTDGSTPTSSSLIYSAPLLVASPQTIHAIAASGTTTSSLTSYQFTSAIAAGTLVWSDEFTNTSGLNAAPNPTTWQFESKAGGFQTVNNELEVYCAWASLASPCNSTPNTYVGATDGYLHIIAQQPSSGVYTSGRIKTEGLLGINYGRVEAMIKLPEGQGLWPAFWLLGGNINTVGWPACGEMDVMEHINAPTPDWIAGTVHMTGASGSSGISSHYGASVASFSASGWHAYGMIWSKGKVQFYVDSPSNIYATIQASSLPAGAVWPFDSGQASFILLNLAVGGSWPGSPNSSTVFPAEMLVDYVRVYTN